ncbi:hypothetical protein DFJ73DRAFT_865233 [Zopfochytrium polystomum]|nr:hypothetical protein DFJ73DRAFT_865233 [Zopfochytrium polystomum]
MMSNNLEPGPVVPDVCVLPPKLAPDASGFVVRLPGDIEIALHKSIEAYHDLAPASTSPFVHGFNGLPGLGPWSIAGVIRITNNKNTAVQHVRVSLDLSASMASKPLAKDLYDTSRAVGLVVDPALSATKRLARWRLVEAQPHRFQIERLVRLLLLSLNLKGKLSSQLQSGSARVLLCLVPIPVYPSLSTIH